MRLRHPLLQALLLIVLAAVIAVVANAFASRTRRLVLPGFYPNALRVPPRVPERVPPPPVTGTAAMPVTTATTATVAQSPAPGQPAIAVPTTTIERPAGTTTAPVPATATTTTAPSPSGAEVRKAPAVDLAKFQPHPDKAYVEISGEEAAALHAKGVLFLDARRSSVYEEGHIAGSRPFSVWEADVDDKVNALFEERQDPADQNKPIVIYCSGGACEDSHMLAQKLWGVQFNNVYVYKDGFPDWQKRGGAVKTGGTP
jgi:rhodanese-related sulfurtransferase